MGNVTAPKHLAPHAAHLERRMMGPTRILFINPDSRRFAGCNVSLLGILDGLDRGRFEPVVAIPVNGEFGSLLSTHGIELFDFELNGWWYPTAAHFHRMLAGLRGRVDSLVQLIRETNIRVVYTNAEYSFEGAFAAALCGVPHVWCMRPPFTHQLDILKYFPLSPSALGQVMDGLSDVIVVDCLRQLDSFPVSVPKEKLRVIESGIDIPAELKTRERARRELTDRLGIPADSRIVLTVSRISPEKDLATFLSTARTVITQYPDDVHFVHLGRATAAAYASEVFDLAERLGLGTRFHQIDECDSIYDVMRAADIFLFTSVDYEGLVRVCAEAMLTEVPVVSTRCGGPEDYVIDGLTGFLAETADVDGLAKHVAYLLDHAAEARSIGIRGRQLISEKYAMNRMNAIWAGLFDELLSRPPRAVMNALPIEILINTLSHIGQTGALASQHDQQIQRQENRMQHIKRLAQIIGLPIRSAKKVFRRFNRSSGNESNVGNP